MDCVKCKMDTLNRELELYSIVEENIQLQMVNLVNRLGKINIRKEEIIGKISRLKALEMFSNETIMLSDYL
jgi:hypothetical protein